VAALVLLASRAGAGSLAAPPVDPGSRIGLGLRTPFEEGTPPGACTTEVTIRNDSRRAGVWEATLETRSAYGALQTTRQTMPVEAKATRTFLLVGLMDGTGWSHSTLQIDGPGVAPEPLRPCDRIWQVPAGSSHAQPSAPFAMSQSLAGGIWDALEQSFGEHSRTRAGLRFDPAGLPGDARAYAGLALVFMRQDEWTALPAGTREAVQDWVALGGRLWLLGPESSETRMGFGLVSTSPLPAGALAHPPEIARRVLDTPGGELDLAMYERYGPWSLPGLMIDPVPPRGLIFSFLLAVALVSGPLNLFWFARGRWRHRVYWTTPLLSAAAALAMGAFILAKDGTGGAGVRWTAVAVRPDAHRAAIVQEQAARTGLLLGSGFRSPDPLRIVPLALDRDWSRGLSSATRVTSGNAWSGWFRSRTLEMHYLETVRPTRARVEVTRGTPLQAVSSIEGVLERLYVVDANGGVWGASAVPAGQRVTLARADDYDAWFADIVASGGPAGRRRLEALNKIPGYFYASGPGAATIETLPAIRWTQKHLLYAGPVQALP
jgi:hypothetical protein